MPLMRLKGTAAVEILLDPRPMRVLNGRTPGRVSRQRGRLGDEEMTRISPGGNGSQDQDSASPTTNRAPMHNEVQRPLTHRRRSALRKIDRLQRVEAV